MSPNKPDQCNVASTRSVKWQTTILLVDPILCVKLNKNNPVCVDHPSGDQRSGHALLVFLNAAIDAGKNKAGMRNNELVSRGLMLCILTMVAHKLLIHNRSGQCSAAKLRGRSYIVTSFHCLYTPLSHLLLLCLPAHTAALYRLHGSEGLGQITDRCQEKVLL